MPAWSGDASRSCVTFHFQSTLTFHYQSTLDAVYVYAVSGSELPIVSSYPDYPHHTNLKGCFSSRRFIEEIDRMITS